jgi:hypothetical protein
MAIIGMAITRNASGDFSPSSARIIGNEDAGFFLR